MSIEGRLTIDMRGAAGHRGIRIESRRPFEITKTFRGRAPEDVIRLLPALFNICGTAQSAACAIALEGALGHRPEDETQRHRVALVALETLREHLIRIVMDWSRFIDVPHDRDAATMVMKTAQAANRALDPAQTAFQLACEARIDPNRANGAVCELIPLLSSQVFAEPVETWLRRETLQDLIEWARPKKTVAQRLVARVIERSWASAAVAPANFLPEIAGSDLQVRLFGDEADDFIRVPAWNGTPYETGAFARNADAPLAVAAREAAGNGLLARLVARLVELARLPAMIFDLIAGNRRATPFLATDVGNGAGVGLSQVEAARGRLVHAVRLEDGLVGDYRILAPTEWNFHPDGAVAFGLANIARKVTADAGTCAELFINAVDPCVGFDLRMPGLGRQEIEEVY